MQISRLEAIYKIMSNPIFWETYDKYIKISSTENFPSMLALKLGLNDLESIHALGSLQN